MQHSSKGRHQAPRSRAVLVGAATAAILAVGGVGYGVSHHGGGSRPTASQASSAGSATPSHETSTSSSSAATGSGTTELASCRATVAAGERLSRAAKATAQDWRAHAGAQWALDAGRISWTEAEKRWASSKARGPQDLAGFATAKAAYDKVEDGCAKTVTATTGTDQAGKAKACSARASALAKVASTGNVINSQWSGHVDLMKTKDTAAGPAYHHKWMAQTAQAKTTLAAYDAATKALATAPACS